MISWDLYYTYLTTVKDRRIRWENERERHNYNVEFSRFNALFSYFRSKPFNVYVCNEFLNTYSNKSNSTRNNQLKVLKAVCKAMRYYNLEVDEVLRPIESIEYLEKRNLQKIIVLTPNEIKELAELRIPYKKQPIQINRRWRAVIYTLALGLRISELCYLTWDQYDGEVFDLSDTKTIDSDRLIYVPPKLRHIIEKLPRYEHNYIFGSHLGRLDKDSANDELKARASILGINKHIHNHLFRHSFANYALTHGVPLLDVMKHLGQKDPKVTAQYAHIGIEQTKKAVEAHELFSNKSVDKIRERLKERLDTIQDRRVIDSLYNLVIPQSF